MPELDGEKGPDLDAKRVAGVFDVSQHCGDCHDGESDPEEVEEAMKISVVAVGVEV